MKSVVVLMAFILGVYSSFAASKAEFEDLPQDNVVLNLEGKTRTIRNWEWPGWNGFRLSVSNGTLVVTGRMSPKHGPTDIYAGGTLRFAKGSSYTPGAGDAQPRWTQVRKRRRKSVT